MRGTEKVLAEWERYCLALAYRFATGALDAEALAQEARVKVWQLAQTYRGEDLTRQIRVSVPNRLISLVRQEQAEMRDARRTSSLERERERFGAVGGAKDSVEPIMAESIDAGIEDQVAFREGVARLLAMADEDERELLDLFIDGSDELHDAIMARGDGSSRYSYRTDWRIGVEMYACVLEWSTKRVRRAREGLRRKVEIAFS